MVKQLWNIIGREISGIHSAAYLLGIFALLSQFLGLIRDRMLAHYFGAGQALDIYYAAFRIPDFIFIMGASLFSFSVLIPFIEEKRSEGKEAVKSFIDVCYTSFFIFTSVLCLGAFILMPELIKTLLPGFSGEALAEATSLSRFLLLSPIFLGFSNLIASITQMEKRFLLYAITPLIYNACTIFGILFLKPSLGLMGIAGGVVIGAIFHGLVQVPFVKKSGLLPDIVFPFSFKEVSRVIKHSLPRTLALSSGNIALIALIALASKMSEGSISVLTFAMNLQSVPLAIIGTSYSMAAFPVLSSLFSSGKNKEFQKLIATTLRHIIFYALPITALFITLRAQVVRTVLGSGAFTWSDTRLTAACLAILSLSVVFQCIALLLVRAYYASGRTILPFYISLISLPITIGLPYVFYKLFIIYPEMLQFLSRLLKLDGVSGSEILSIPIGYTIGTLVQALAFVYFARQEFIPIKKDILNTTFQSAMASIVAGVVSYIGLNIFSNFFNLETLVGIFLQGLCAGILGVLGASIVLLVTGNNELKEIIKALKVSMFKSKPLLPEQSDLTP